MVRFKRTQRHPFSKRFIFRKSRAFNAKMNIFLASPHAQYRLVFAAFSFAFTHGLSFVLNVVSHIASPKSLVSEKSQNAGHKSVSLLCNRPMIFVFFHALHLAQFENNPAQDVEMREGTKSIRPPLAHTSCLLSPMPQ